LSWRAISIAFMLHQAHARYASCAVALSTRAAQSR
jgi:hypothetical protein